MPMCRMCGESVTSGVVFHNECAEKLMLERSCDTCKWRETDSYKFYGYPCKECKYRAGNHYERKGADGNGKERD